MYYQVSVIAAMLVYMASVSGSAPEIVREYNELLEKSEVLDKIPCVAMMMFQGGGIYSGHKLRPRIVLCMCDREEFFGREDGSIVCEAIEDREKNARYSMCMEIPMEIYNTFIRGNKLRRTGIMKCSCYTESISTPIYKSIPWFVLNQSQTGTLFSLLDDMGAGVTYTTTRIFSKEDEPSDTGKHKEHPL